MIGKLKQVHKHSYQNGENIWKKKHHKTKTYIQDIEQLYINNP